MSFKLKYSLFPTESIYAMRQFISEVLDVEILEEEGQYYFSMGGVLFQLTEIRPLNILKDVAHFEFEVPKGEAFKALKDKVDFFYFRQNKKLLNSSPKSKSFYEGKNLRVFDPDGRLWNFSLQGSSEHIVRSRTSSELLN